MSAGTREAVLLDNRRRRDAVHAGERKRIDAEYLAFHRGVAWGVAWSAAFTALGEWARRTDTHRRLRRLK